MSIVFVEGNIGSGKSSLLYNLDIQVQNDEFIQVVQEGLQEWVQVKDESGNILHHFYNDQEKYSFVLQMVILTQRHYAIKELVNQMNSKCGKDWTLVLERSSSSCDLVFRKTLPLMQIEHKAFDYIYNKLQEDVQTLGVNIQYIYIDTPADICLQRIKERARPEEQTIQLEYLQSLDSKYKELVTNVNAIVIDGTLSKEQVLQQCSQHILKKQE